jgi:hypothetical protein
MYLIKIELKYGEFTVSAETYQEAINEYKEIKEEYKSIPCKITMYKEDQIQFVKENSNHSFDTLFKNLLDALEELGKYQIELNEKEDEFNRIKDRIYHNIEETNLNELSIDEQLNLLHNAKSEFTKRRLIKIENQKNYGFYKTYQMIIERMLSYVDSGEKKVRERENASRYNKPYYNEDIKVKEKLLKKIDKMRNSLN